MQFWIQVSSPDFRAPAAELETASDFIQEGFDLCTESAILFWHSVAIPLDYKYDVNVMLEEVLELIETLTEQDNGSASITWPSDTFRATWTLDWSGDKLQIGAQWMSVSGGLEAVLSQHPTLVVSGTQFIAEWGELLRFLFTLLIGTPFPEVAAIRRLLERIDGRGALYD